MKLVHKRILIFFSVALNLGFLAMALYHNVDRVLPKPERRWQELMTIVEGLDLSSGKTAEVIELMAGFRKEMEALDRDNRGARIRIMDMAARPGPLDREQLHRLIQASGRYSLRKKEMFEAHIIRMRRVLGDEKGAEFFSRLRDHIRSKRKSPHS